MPPVGSKRLALTCGNESIGLLMPLGTASLQQTVTTPISKAKSELHSSVNYFPYVLTRSGFFFYFLFLCLTYFHSNNKGCAYAFMRIKALKYKISFMYCNHFI